MKILLMESCLLGYIQHELIFSSIRLIQFKHIIVQLYDKYFKNTRINYPNQKKRQEMQQASKVFQQQQSRQQKYKSRPVQKFIFKYPFMIDLIKKKVFVGKYKQSFDIKLTYNIYIQDIKNQKYSRRMEIMTNRPDIHYINNISLQLQTLQLNNLYLLTKKIIYKFNIQQLSITNHSLLKGHIVQIIQFVVAKIQNNTKLSLDKFVVYMSIFSYICSMLESESFGIQLTEMFYFNLRNYIQQIINNFMEKCFEKDDNVVKGNLSIILCCLSSLTKEQKLRYPRIYLTKIFNPQLIKKIISLKLTNLQKLMKYYKSLILYLTKIKLTLNQRQQLIKSIYYHFVNCPDFYQTQIAQIFCLSSILQDKKIYSRIQTILVEQQKYNILTLCFEYLRECNQPSHFSMIVDLCQKLIRGMEEIGESLLDGVKFYSLYIEIHNKFGNAERLPNFLQKILSKISSNSCFYVYKQISQKQTLSLSQLQIIYICTKKISHQFLFYILNSDKWQKYLIFSNIKQNSHTNYKRYLVQKIILNIIKSSQSNSDLYSVLKNLAGYSG